MLNFFTKKEKENTKSEKTVKSVEKLDSNESMNSFEREKTEVEKSSNNSTTVIKKSKELSNAVSKIDRDIKIRYKKAIATRDIAKFHQEALSLILDHLKIGEFGEHKAFMREIEYFVHYLFLMLQDDFFFGDRLFVHRMTKLDDYIFSQYRRIEDLEDNIQKITILSYSNRFDRDPRSNLLAYFVFIEESGIELISLLQDFYSLLHETQTKKSWYVKSIFGSILNRKRKMDYLRKEGDVDERDDYGTKTFMTVQPSFVENSKVAQIKVYRDVLTPLKNINKDGGLE